MSTQTLTQNPLGVLDQTSLSEKALSVFQRLETTQFLNVRKKLAKSGEVNPDRMEIVELEFKRFMALTYLVDGPVGMSSKEVDAYWHQFILFTRSYFDFCMTTFGRFIHHQPNTDEMAVDSTGKENFQNAYLAHFGEIPAIWLSEQPCTDCCSNDCSSIGDSCSGDHGQDE